MTGSTDRQMHREQEGMKERTRGQRRFILLKGLYNFSLHFPNDPQITDRSHAIQGILVKKSSHDSITHMYGNVDVIVVSRVNINGMEAST